jgi:hypothetical protein
MQELQARNRCETQWHSSGAKNNLLENQEHGTIVRHAVEELKPVRIGNSNILPALDQLMHIA